MIVTRNLVHKKLKVNFSKGTIEVGHGTESCEVRQCVPVLHERSYITQGSTHTEMSKLHKCVVTSSAGKKMSIACHLESKSAVSGNKRGSPCMVEGPRVKRQKIGMIIKAQCGKILQELMSHESGWVFSEPVNPKELDIPDYFSVISSPMDLGTVKTNLAKNKYSDVEDFAADVRLCFANAMLYNPPNNKVHKAASNLSKIFEKKWKVFGASCNSESSNIIVKQTSGSKKKEILDSFHKALLSLKEKVPPESAQVGLVKTTNCTTKMSSKSTCKGTDSWSRHVGGSVSTKLPLSLVTCKCGKCGTTKCQCISSDSTHSTMSDISSARSVVRDTCAHAEDALKQEFQTKSSLTSKMSKSGSDGSLSALDEESLCVSSQFTALAAGTSGEGWSTPQFDLQLSPKRALRAAQLKSRFADTILKAQQKTLLDPAGKADLAKLNQEKAKLERKQREERARIEAQIKAAEAAVRLRAETELKLQRERAREAARIAVEKVERSVDLEDNIVMVKELEALGCSLYATFRCGAASFGECTRVRSPLERLGLFLKEECVREEEEEDETMEEGEILC